MIWVQGLVCFALWIGYGVYRTRGSQRIRVWAFGVPSGRRALFGGAMFLGGAALLALALVAIMAGHGLGSNGMLPWAWLLVAVTGLGYAHLQILGTALLVSLAQEAVTRERAEASEPTVISPPEGSPSETGNEFLP